MIEFNKAAPFQASSPFFPHETLSKILKRMIIEAPKYYPIILNYRISITIIQLPKMPRFVPEIWNQFPFNKISILNPKVSNLERKVDQSFSVEKNN